MQSKKFPKKCQYCGSLKFDRDAVGSFEWMNFRCGSSCDQRGEWSQSDECRITELEAIEAAKDARIASLTSEVDRLREENGKLKFAAKMNARILDDILHCGGSFANTERKLRDYVNQLLKEPDHA